MVKDIMNGKSNVNQLNQNVRRAVGYVWTELFVKSMLVSHLFLQELVESKR